MVTAIETSVGGMKGIISQLTTGVTVETIFGVVSDVMPFVIIMIIVSFGVYELRKVVKGASKAKVKFWPQSG